MVHATPRRAARRFALIIAGGVSVAMALLGGLAPAPAGAAVPAATAANLSISGHVSLGTTATAAGPGDVTVDLYYMDTNGLTVPQYLLFATTTTDSAGNYQLSGTGGPFVWRIKFTYNGPGGYLTTWWRAGAGVTAAYASDPGEAGYIVLPATSPTIADITLPLAGAISGEVSTTAGAVPVDATGIQVTATRIVDNTALDPLYRPDTVSEYVNADGTYSLSSLMPGSYHLTFAQGSRAVYAESAAGATVADPGANVIQVVGSGQTLSAVNSVMFLPATVAGNVSCPGCSLPSTYYAPLEEDIYRQTSTGWVFVSASNTYGSYSDSAMLPGTYRTFGWANDGPQHGWGHSSTFTLSEGQHGTADVAIVRPPTTRLAGADRFGTSVAVSQNNLDSASDFTPGVPVVYIADGLAYPDALSAGPAAAAQQGPLLLVNPTSIPASVAAELTRLKPQKIVVAGGVGSVSEAVFTQLQGYVSSSTDVVRVAGTDRYATSIAIARFAFPKGASNAYLATGVNFPDALSAGGAAAKKHGPVILVRGSAVSVDPATRNALASLHASSVDIVGGTGSVSAAFESALQAIPGIQATRLSGGDRYATSQAVDEDAFETSMDAPSPSYPFAFLAQGTNFPDALSGGALAGHLGAPLFVIPSNCIPERVMQDLENLQIETLVLLGGGGSLTLAVSSFTKCPA